MNNSMNNGNGNGNINYNHNSNYNSIMDAITALQNRIDQQNLQIQNLMNHQLLPAATSNDQLPAYNNAPLTPLVAYLDPTVRSRLTENPNRLGNRDILFYPLGKPSASENIKPPTVYNRLDDLFEIFHRQKYGEAAPPLDDGMLQHLKKPYQKLAADVCQLIASKYSPGLVHWGKVDKVDRAYFCLVFEDVAAKKIEFGKIHHCEARWGANAFLTLGFKAIRQKHGRQQKKLQATQDNTPRFATYDDGENAILSDDSNEYQDDDGPLVDEEYDDDSLRPNGQFAVFSPLSSFPAGTAISPPPIPISHARTPTPPIRRPARKSRRINHN